MSWVDIQLAPQLELIRLFIQTADCPGVTSPNRRSNEGQADPANGHDRDAKHRDAYHLQIVRRGRSPRHMEVAGGDVRDGVKPRRGYKTFRGAVAFRRAESRVKLEGRSEVRHDRRVARPSGRGGS